MYIVFLSTMVERTGFTARAVPSQETTALIFLLLLIAAIIIQAALLPTTLV